MSIGHFGELLPLQHPMTLSLGCLLSTHTHPVIFPSSVVALSTLALLAPNPAMPETPAYSSSVMSSQPLKLSMSKSTVLLFRYYS